MDHAIALPGQGLMWRTRNLVFLLAVLLLFYTLPKPAPVDVAFVAALALSPFVNQQVTNRFLLFVLLTGAWTTSFFIAAQPVMRDPNVPFELVQKTYAVLLGITVCFTAMSWRKQQFMVFLKVYVAACIIAAILGIIGFATRLELLSSFGRAKGLLNEPNMYAALLCTGVLACLYLNSQTRRHMPVMIAAGIIAIGLILSFSRAGIFALFFCGGLYLFIVNRRNPRQLILLGLGGITGLVVVLGLLFAFGGESFTDLLADRLTIAKQYDLGREGRFARYERALPIILDNPLGIGTRQDGKIFVEPIHNIFIGSFLVHGWLAGFAYLALTIFSFVFSIRNQRMTSDPLPTLFFCCYLSAIIGAMLHEAEHWRPLWIFTGMVWGLNVKAALDPPRPR